MLTLHAAGDYYVVSFLQLSVVSVNCSVLTLRKLLYDHLSSSQMHYSVADDTILFNSITCSHTVVAFKIVASCDISTFSQKLCWTYLKHVSDYSTVQ